MTTQYLQQIGDFTINLLATDRYQSIKFALSFWQNLCREEEKAGANSANIIPNCFPSLMGIIFMGLAINEYEDDQVQVSESVDEDQFTVAIAASSLL